MHSIFRSVVQGVGCELPEKVVTNADLAKVMDTSDEWILERTGIQERRIAGVEIGTSDLAVAASKKAIEHAQCDPQEIDLIIASTLSPDYTFPGIGVMVQNKLGLKNVAGFDVRGQCSGFTWALSSADAFIRSGQYKKNLGNWCRDP